ncbi:MAG: hypothetical protein K9J85_08445 [Desulfobacteraceae bacterium]|nr:hypothetical protein [Desulfobacteraceae bacterium]
MKKQVFLVLFILAVLAGTGWLVFLSGSPENDQAAGEPKQKKPPLVETRPAVHASVSRTIELTGSVEPYKKAELASPAEGPKGRLKT